MLNGGCTCGEIRYRLTDKPLFTHACHCTWCQRESGGPLALNAMIETDCVALLRGSPVEVPLPSASGKGQIMLRCPTCQITLWSYYAGAGRKMAFLRVGTLDDASLCPPDIHIFTSTKLPWFVLNDDIPAVPEYYQRSKYWPAASLARRAAALES
jgi:hypothetical protein